MNTTGTAARPRSPAADRWVSTGTALLFLATAIVGFGPNTYGVATGRLEMPPAIVHVHAAVMFAWLFLLLAQAVLGANRRFELHARLGMASFALVPAMLTTMVVLAVTNFEVGTTSNGIAVVQARRLILFTAFYLWAIHARRRDVESHRRLNFWATLVLLDAAILRMPWLPDLGTDNIAVTHSFLLLLMVPAFVHDLWRRRNLHRTHWIGLVLTVATSALASFLW